MFSTITSILGVGRTVKIYVRSTRFGRSSFSINVAKDMSVGALVDAIGDAQEGKDPNIYGYNCVAILIPIDGDYVVEMHTQFATDATVGTVLCRLESMGIANTRNAPIIFLETFGEVPCIWVKALQDKAEPFQLMGLTGDQTTLSQVLAAIRAHQSNTKFHFAYGGPIKGVVYKEGEAYREVTGRYAQLLSSIPGYGPNSHLNPLLFSTYTTPNSLVAMYEQHVLGYICEASNVPGALNHGKPPRQRSSDGGSVKAEIEPPVAAPVASSFTTQQRVNGTLLQTIPEHGTA